MCWQDQMIRDISMVLSNDYDATKEIEGLVGRLTGVDLANAIADVYYNAISEVLDAHVERHGATLGVQLLQEIAYNLGVGVFDGIAAQFDPR